jgi:hypothetical protein
MKCKRALDYGSNYRESDVMTMHDYAKRGWTEDIMIPYARNDRKMAKEGVRLALLSAYEVVPDLHREGKSLKGLFSSRNFLISLKSKKVVLHGVEILPYHKDDDKVDKLQFVTIV